jgi:hypothetical protein
MPKCTPTYHNDKGKICKQRKLNFPFHQSLFNREVINAILEFPNLDFELSSE